MRKSGEMVRITAQLIKASDGFHVWSENFDRQLKDIFVVQDEIAGLIATQLQLKLAATSAAATTAAVNPEAYRLYLEGRHFWNLRTYDNMERAQNLFRRAIALENYRTSRTAGVATTFNRTSAKRVFVLILRIPTRSHC